MDELLSEIDIPEAKDQQMLVDGKALSLHDRFESINIQQQPLSFVDGGSAVLFESSDLCVGYIRVASINYATVDQKSRSKEEFFILVKCVKDHYLVKTSPKTSFDGLAVKPQNVEDKPSTIVSLIRRLAELEYASKQKNTVVLDGSLESKHPLETLHIATLSSVIAVSKTCSLNTIQGSSIVGVLYRMSSSTVWRYVLSETLSFAHLHAQSRYVFRIDIKNADVGVLMPFCSDPIFLGYPYGLIEADQYARISDQEAESLRTQVMLKLGKRWNSFSTRFNSMNAHSILDKIRF